MSTHSQPASPFRSGSVVIATLANPREKFWGTILHLLPISHQIRGKEVLSVSRSKIDRSAGDSPAVAAAPPPPQQTRSSPFFMPGCERAVDDKLCGEGFLGALGVSALKTSQTPRDHPHRRPTTIHATISTLDLAPSVGPLQSAGYFQPGGLLTL